MTQLEDGNVFWQALPGGACLKLTFCPFSFSAESTLYLACYISYSVLLTVAVISRDVTTFALLDILFLYVSFSCLIWTLQHFASVQTRKGSFRRGTLWLESSLTETLSTKLACQRALKWLASLRISLLISVFMSVQWSFHLIFFLHFHVQLYAKSVLIKTYKYKEKFVISCIQEFFSFNFLGCNLSFKPSFHRGND